MINKQLSKFVDLVNNASNFNANVNAKSFLTGFNQFDSLFKGVDKSRFMVIGGRPMMGKSSFLMEIARKLVQNSCSVLYISGKERENLCMARFLAPILEIPTENLSSLKLTSDEIENLNESIENISNFPINFLHKNVLSEITEKAKELYFSHQIKAILIDDISEIDLGDFNFLYKEHEIKPKIYSSIKSLSKLLNVPIIATTRIKNTVESRGGDKKPLLSDFYAQSTIENKPDVISALYRPIFYFISEDEDGNSTENICNLLILKNNLGKSKSIDFSFNEEFLSFNEIV